MAKKKEPEQAFPNPYGFSDQQNMGLMLGAFITAAIGGLRGRNPLESGFKGYAAGVNSVYDQRQRQLDEEKNAALIDAERFKMQQQRELAPLTIQSQVLQNQNLQGEMQNRLWNQGMQERQLSMQQQTPVMQFSASPSPGMENQYIVNRGGGVQQVASGIDPSILKAKIAAENKIDARASQTSMKLRAEHDKAIEQGGYNKYDEQMGMLGSAWKQYTENPQNFVGVDQALIMVYNKMLDPSSVVRESEFARTPEELSLLDRAKAAASRGAWGGILNDSARRSLMQMANRFYQIAQMRRQSVEDKYMGLADKYGVPRDLVVTPPPDMSTALAGTPGFGGQGAAQAGPEVKQVGGRTFFKKDGKWFEGSPQ